MQQKHVFFVAVTLLLFFGSILSQQTDQILSLPGYGPIPSNAKQYAGFLPVDSKQQGNLFYWYFEKEDKTADTPLLIWLNGGPGCSSISAGLLAELGPLHVNDDGNSLYDNPFGWNRVGDLVFIDQPVGVGFSYTSNPQGYVKDENEVATHLTNALEQFYQRYPTTKSQPLYLFAESYGGKYIPAFASEIVARNANRTEKILLRGIGLGNALVDPIIQRFVQTNQAYYANIIGQDQVQVLQDFQRQCISQIQQGNYNDGVCDLVFQYISISSGNINGYDVRTFEPSYNKNAVLNYLNRRDVQEAIHITSQHQNNTWRFDSCNDLVYEYLKDEILISYKQTIKNLYSASIRMLFYAGNFDLKDGPVGVDAYLQTLGYADFNSSPRNLWLVNNTVAGYHKTDGKLIDFVVVHGAGHYVPTNQPAHSLDMINRFINKIPYCNPSKDIFSMPTPGKNNEYLTLSCNVVDNICQQLFKNCSLHGHCGNNGKCVCDENFVGVDCSTPLYSIKQSEQFAYFPQQQHSWQYFQLDSLDSEEEVFAVSISYRLDSIQKDIPVLPPQENLIGEGLAGSIQPFNKVCVYGKKNDLPSWSSFDFVICSDVQTAKLNHIFSINTPTADSKTRWMLGVFNSKLSSLQLDISYNKLKSSEAVPTMWQFWVALAVIGVAFGIISVAIVFAVVIYFRSKQKRQYTAIN